MKKQTNIHKRIVRFIGVLAALSINWVTAQAADGRFFTYRFEVPQGTSNCAQMATDYAGKLAMMTGATETQGVCQSSHLLVSEGVSYYLNTLVISYKATSELTPVRATFAGSEFLGEPSEAYPLFTRYQGCLDQLQMQLPNFENYTGIKVFSARCDPARDAFTSGYVLKIEGFGNPKERLFEYRFRPGLAQTPPAGSKIMDTLNQIFLADGVHVVFKDSTHILYYAKRAEILTEHSMGAFPVESECQMQLDEATRIYVHAQLQFVTAVCEPMTYGGFYLSLAGIGPDRVSSNSDRGAYYTMDSCLGDKERVAHQWFSRGYSVVGVICGRRTVNGIENFYMTVYSNNR